ncbi:MAG: valine--tRNA ligase, partial [Planctomycetes bacterium]|nr:valine--tRNA ligase [Planctomycetota bacterium]
MGHNTLWMPGTDHAGIATQAVVEKRLKEEENLNRHDIGREELVKRIWKWKDAYETRIISQLKLMGCSCDFERTRFTLDEGCSRAVRETFFKLFKDGYIVRGKRLVNWDCELQTAVADDEVYHETVKGKFYHFKYPLKDVAAGVSAGRNENVDSDPLYVVIATTRPETMLGDTAVAVNPNDERYKHLVGKTVILPLMGREIPIIADEWADPQRGSGCVKITPAHDPNDYEVGLRHNLPMINILNPDGTINENGNSADGKYKYAGMDRFAARKAVLRDLEELDLIEKIEDHQHDVGHSDRSKTQIEPYLSDQWFLSMNKLADPALEAVRDGSVRFVPERYKHAYLDWLGEKRDWCISRQLWWGHRIPVWKATFSSGRIGAMSSLVAIRARQSQLLSELKECLEELAKASDCEGQFVVSAQDECSPSFCFICPLTEHASKQLDDVRSGMGWGRAVGQGVKDRYVEAISSIDPRYDARVKMRRLLYHLVPDEDVLDTWFSSALWPHSTLGWPEGVDQDRESARAEARGSLGSASLLDYYYPTSVLITSRDIVTLWVVRMVLAGLYNIGKKPFHEVYIHPKILDGRGVTMSKSKGNGVDPLDIIEVFGADALRFGVAAMTTETQDIRMPVEYRCPHCEKTTPQTANNMFERGGNPVKVLACKHCKKEFATRWADVAVQEEKGLALMVSDKFEAARNFTNKLWNAARFAFMNLDGAEPQTLTRSDLPAEDRWILAELSAVIRSTHEALANYQYSRATIGLRDFFWSRLCDWYLEMVKYRIAEDHAAAAARQILAFCLDQVLRLLHPIVPFITERLWQTLNEIAPQRGLPGVDGVGIVFPGSCAQPQHEGPQPEGRGSGSGSPGEVLTIAMYPPAGGYPALDDAQVSETFQDLQNATRAVREVRNTAGIAPKDSVAVTIKTTAERTARLQEEAHILKRMARIDDLTIDPAAGRPDRSAIQIVGDLQIFVHDVIDDDAQERQRIEKAVGQLDKRIKGTESKLANENYVRSAPVEVVAETREILNGLKAERGTFQDILALLK